MSKIHNLYEYQLALKIVKEVPEALKTIDKCIEMLDNHKDYVDVLLALRTLEDSKLLLELTLDRYEYVVNKKGKNNE